MVTNARIADLIREDKAEEIHDAIDDGAFFHMQTFTPGADRARRSTARSTREIAANAATNRHDFLVALEHGAQAPGRTTGAARPSKRGGRGRAGELGVVPSGRKPR